MVYGDTKENQMCHRIDSLKAENKRLKILIRAKDARMVAAVGRLHQIERNCANLRRWLIPAMKGKNGE